MSSSSAGRVASPSGINGEWTHDLHQGGVPAKGPRAWREQQQRQQQQQQQQQQPQRQAGGRGRGAGSLASRVTVPGAIAPSKRVQRRSAQVAQALVKMELQPATAARTNAVSARLTAAGGNRGLSIRGLAGPYVVMAQNFAPGTTAADIESAMTPVGGIVSSCRLLKVTPIVIAEIVFESKEGADRVIETFNNQTADGRVLHVYPKIGPVLEAAPAAAAAGSGAAGVHPAGPRAAQTSSNVVDGSMGFDDPMDMEVEDDGAAGPDGNGGPGGRLYSDAMVADPAPGRFHQQGGGRYGRPASNRNGRGGNAGRRDGDHYEPNDEYNYR